MTSCERALGTSPPMDVRWCDFRNGDATGDAIAVDEATAAATTACCRYEAIGIRVLSMDCRDLQEATRRRRASTVVKSPRGFGVSCGSFPRMQ